MQPNEHRPSPGGPTKFTQTLGKPAWVALTPASIVSVGSAEQPVERLLTLQSAIAKAAHAATTLCQLRLRHPLHAVLTFRFR
jgi:hypothetical protein